VGEEVAGGVHRRASETTGTIWRDSGLAMALQDELLRMTPPALFTCEAEIGRGGWTITI
jgi:hypothetical protein